MCLITRQKKPRITKRDRIVYKYVHIDPDGSIWSYFITGFEWRNGRVRQQKLGISSTTPLASHKFDAIVATAYLKHLDKKVTVVSTGLHAATTKKRLTANKNHAPIRKFLIPKGSEIFTDITGLIVSNKMMLIDTPKNGKK